jgi:hypothetical protein
VGPGQLQHLALGDDAGGVGQHPEGAHLAGVDHQLEGPGKQEVADQHAGRRTPDQVGGDLAAAQLGAVDHIVVQQGGGVNELDSGGEAVGVGPGPGRRQRGPRPRR